MWVGNKRERQSLTSESVKGKVAQSCLTLWDPINYRQHPRLPCPSPSAGACSQGLLIPEERNQHIKKPAFHQPFLNPFSKQNKGSISCLSFIFCNSAHFNFTFYFRFPTYRCKTTPTSYIISCCSSPLYSPDLGHKFIWKSLRGTEPTSGKTTQLDKTL